MLLFSVTTLLTWVLSFILAFLVIRKNLNSKLNWGWFFVSFFVGVWSFGLWGVLNAGSYQKALIFQYILDFGGILVPIAYFRFTIIILGLTKKKRHELILAYVVGIVLVVLSFFPIFKRGVEDASQYGFNYWVVPGTLYVFFPVLFSFFMSYAFYLGIRNFKNLTGAVKSQVRYVLLSGAIGFIGGVTNFFPQLIGVYPIGNYFVVLYIVAVAYAMIKHRLMGIRILVSKVYVTLLVALSFYTLYYAIVLFDETFLGGLYTPGAIFIGIPVSIVIAAGIIPFLNYIQKSSDIIFFRGNNPRSIIKDLSIKISGVIELKQLIKILAREFRKIVGADEMSIIFIAQKPPANSKEIKVCVARKGLLKDKTIKAGNPIYRIIVNKRRTIVKEELDKKKDKALLREMDHYKAKIIAPLEVRKKIVGIILLGEKITQDAYTKEDIEFLEIIGAQAAIAIENARLYKESKDFNMRLEKEVENATNELQKTNRELIESNDKLTRAYEKLTKLDRAKSEFLSIASHQLRTPLTSIKGFTSLLLEGTYGKVSASVRATLEKIFISNERLIKLVEDLLNISRIESGKLAFDFKEDKIDSLMEEIVDSMKIAAKNKKLSFKYKKPEKPIEPFVFDAGKLKEVVSNLIDNSIKYTKQGFVEVRLENKGKFVRIVVEDSGMGIRKGELEYIFERFQRGKDVNQVHTEGVGLGLYVCKKIMEAHKGRVWAESAGLEKGSRFIIELKKNLKAMKQVKKPEIFGK